MIASATTQPVGGQEAVDLAALGEAYRPLVGDTSPEVADVINTLPWWAARGLLYLTAGFVIVLLVWAGLSEVDVVVESRGVLAPEGAVREVQAAGTGSVQNVFVREGDAVERGQALVQLDATEMRTRLGKLREEFSVSRAQLRQLMAKAPIAETLEQQNRISRLQREIAAAELSLNQTTISAPFAGVITVLAVKGPGAVLQGGQTVASIAPFDARLVVEAQVQNKDIALVEKGMEAKLRFDAFPFQDYGTTEGVVIQMSPDARVDGDGGSFYTVTILPRRTEFLARGKRIALRPGLALSAEIVTERRSILSLLLAPFRDLKGGAPSGGEGSADARRGIPEA